MLSFAVISTKWFESIRHTYVHKIITSHTLRHLTVYCKKFLIYIDVAGTSFKTQKKNCSCLELDPIGAISFDNF